jgi:hypothetical protein
MLWFMTGTLSRAVTHCEGEVGLECHALFPMIILDLLRADGCRVDILDVRRRMLFFVRHGCY